MINIGSIAGLKPQVFPTFSYDASKADRSFEHEVSGRVIVMNITVNALAFGVFSDKNDR